MTCDSCGQACTPGSWPVDGQWLCDSCLVRLHVGKCNRCGSESLSVDWTRAPAPLATTWAFVRCGDCESYSVIVADGGLSSDQADRLDRIMSGVVRDLRDIVHDRDGNPDQ